MNKEERDFKGVWIPKDIWLDENLTIIEKCLIVEIDSLDNSDKGCFASNEYLGKFIGVSEGRCANIISDLKKRGYIEQCFFDGRNRGLKINKCESRVHENVKPELLDSLKQTKRKREHSNTDSNTINNNKKTSKKESDYVRSILEINETDLSNDAKDLLKKWVNYKYHVKKESYETTNFISKFINEIKEFGFASVKEAIESSLANEYKGYFPKHKQTHQNGKIVEPAQNKGIKITKVKNYD